jgi:hypothetical protein
MKAWWDSSVQFAQILTQLGFNDKSISISHASVEDRGRFQQGIRVNQSRNGRLLSLLSSERWY